MKSSLPTILGSVPLIPDGFIQKQVYIHNCIDQQLPDEQRTRNGFSIVCQNCTHRRSRNHTMIPPKFAIALGAWTAYLIELRNCGMPPFSPSPLQLFSVMVWYKPGRGAEIFCSAIYPSVFFLGGVEDPEIPQLTPHTMHTRVQNHRFMYDSIKSYCNLEEKYIKYKTPMTTKRTFSRSHFCSS